MPWNTISSDPSIAACIRSDFPGSIATSSFPTPIPTGISIRSRRSPHPLRRMTPRTALVMPTRWLLRTAAAHRYLSSLRPSSFKNDRPNKIGITRPVTAHRPTHRPAKVMTSYLGMLSFGLRIDGGIQECQRPQQSRVARSQSYSDESPHAQPDEMARPDSQMTNECSRILGKRIDIVSFAGHAAFSLPAVIEGNAPVAAAETGHLRSKHLMAQKKAVGEYDRFSIASCILEVQSGTVQADMRRPSFLGFVSPNLPQPSQLDWRVCPGPHAIDSLAARIGRPSTSSVPAPAREPVAVDFVRARPGARCRVAPEARARLPVRARRRTP